jgi:outer membrane protein TolC
LKLLWLTLFLISALFSEDEKGLTLEDAITILKNENLEIEIAKLNEEVALKNSDIASSNHWGKLDFSQSAMRTDDAGNAFGFRLSSREANFENFGFDEFLGQMGDLQNDPTAGNRLLATQPDKLNYPEGTNLFQTKLTYQLPLYAGGKIVTYQKISKNLERIAKLDREIITREKIYELKKSFFDMALLNSTIEQLSKILENINTLQKMVKSMIVEGYGKEVDLLEIEARKIGVERFIKQTEAQKSLLYHYLSFLLNREVSKIDANCGDIEMPQISADEVRENNLMIKKAEKGLDIHKEMVELSQANYLPEIGAFGEIQTSDDTFLGDANDHKSYTIGVKLTWNIFNGFGDKARIEEAKIKRLKMERELSLAKEGIALQYNKIATEIKNISEDIRSLQAELDLSNRIYQNYEEQYRENLKSMSEVIIKQSDQIKKITELLQLRNKRNERIFALEKLYIGE